MFCFETRPDEFSKKKKNLAFLLTAMLVTRGLLDEKKQWTQ